MSLEKKEGGFAHLNIEKMGYSPPMSPCLSVPCSLCKSRGLFDCEKDTAKPRSMGEWMGP